MKLLCWLATLSLLHVHNSDQYIMFAHKLTCYSAPVGEETKHCDKSRGFKSCFVRHNEEGSVTGRGCSTKRTKGSTCETHSYGSTMDKFCYCPSNKCNLANTREISYLIFISGISLAVISI
eukprot:TRINITY_DN68479_c0_g1_i1.p1 TRINITY_DN68479_c0_g1~~TRINITY_DN68479_c0_g1_i1.p1  ORF type:complete len:121 (+),score=16.42 TRINITY_DN68479_c0_g1_i1:187-549(+)